MSVLDREHTVAPTSYNRWLIPPAALAIHLCIGMAYGFSVFWKPLGQALVDAQGQPLAACGAGAVALDAKLDALARALVATDCNWSQFDLGWMYTLFFVLLGIAAATWGGWLERAGPRKAGPRPLGDPLGLEVRNRRDERNLASAIGPIVAMYGSVEETDWTPNRNLAALAGSVSLLNRKRISAGSTWGSVSIVPEVT